MPRYHATNGRDLNDFALTSISVFANYFVPGVWAVNASLGYSYFDPTRGESHSSPTTATTITYHLARATLTLGADAGFSEVSHPTLRRVVMRIDL